MSPVWPAAEAFRADSSELLFSWLVRLRWLALLGVASIILLAGPVLGRVPVGSAPWLWSVAVALAAYNTALAVLGPSHGASWLTSFGMQITIDCIALASLVHLAGGVENPFLPLFVLHVVNANIVLSGGGALRVLGLAIALTTAVVLAEGSGVIAHHCLRHGAEPCLSGSVNFRALAVLGGLVLTLVTSSLFTRFLTVRLRQGQQKLVASISELNSEKDKLAHAYAEAEAAHARLQAVIDCMGEAVIFVGPNRNVLLSNRRAREFWGARNPAADLEELFEGVSEDRSSLDTVVRFERAGRAFEATYAQVRSVQGETLGQVVAARDITDRLAVEKHLMHEEQMSVVGKLAAAVAHEVNNPIGVVSLYSQHALAMLPSDSPVHSHLETIHRNAESCRKIVSGLLNLARPARPTHRPIDLRQLCREIVDSVHPLVVAAGARISSGSHKSDVPLWAKADAGMLRQAVLNLAVNAIEAIGPGGEISVGAYETQDGKVTARAIEVRDTGVGITADEIEKIFQPFFTTKECGTGLGLSIAENVIKSHGGRIDVESVVGTGTVFRVVLPDHMDGAAASSGPPHELGLVALEGNS